MTQETISADPNNRGWLTIKQHGAIVLAFYAFDVVSVTVDSEDGATQIAMRNLDGTWYRTTVSVDEVYRAIAAASTLYESSSRRKSA
jgi:hypothetical protein